MPLAGNDRNRSLSQLFPAFVLGSMAGFLGSVIILHLSSRSSLVDQVLVTGCSTFLAGLIAAWFAPLRPFGSWALILVGVGFGVMCDALFVHPVFNGGERNLWPIEIALFVALGFLPCAGGIWLGRSVFHTG